MSKGIFYSWRQSVALSDLPSTTRLVLYVLGMHMNDMGESCFPSVETISKESGLSKKSVITHLKVAQDNGFISQSKHGYAGQKWARNEYKATFPSMEKGGEPQVKKAKKVVNLRAEGGEPQVKKVVKEVHSSSPIDISNNTHSDSKATIDQYASTLTAKLKDDLTTAGLSLGETKRELARLHLSGADLSSVVDAVVSYYRDPAIKGREPQFKTGLAKVIREKKYQPFIGQSNAKLCPAEMRMLYHKNDIGDLSDEGLAAEIQKLKSGAST